MSSPSAAPARQDLPTVAIIGRPNVGKSTLFNRLIGKSLAMVHDSPGVTRDSKESIAHWGNYSCRIFDTPGLDDSSEKTSLAARMTAQATAIAARADIVLFVIDARLGALPDDKVFARLLRKTGRPVVLVLNKAETQAIADAGSAEAAKLGYEDPIAISAAHNLGIADLWMAMAELDKRIESAAPDEEETFADWASESDFVPEILDEAAEEASRVAEDNIWRTRPLRLTIIGRPNVGKSTLTNALLGTERMLTGPEAGLTRESVMHDWAWRQRPIQLVDTAGMRKKAKIKATLEDMSVGETLRAIRLSHVALLILDATLGCEKQDLQIARHVAEEGRALVIALNKWDAVKDKSATLKAVEHELNWSLAQMRGVPLVTISALQNKGVPALMKAILETERIWNTRISTSRLNRWLGIMQERNQTPLVEGRRLKLRYMTQFKARPPTFVLASNQPLSAIPDNYLRYLANGLEADFGLRGVPIRWLVRKSENPYIDKAADTDRRAGKPHSQRPGKKPGKMAVRKGGSKTAQPRKIRPRRKSRA